LTLPENHRRKFTMFRFVFSSHSYRSLHATCLLAGLMLFPLAASLAEGAPSLSALGQQITDFDNSPQYRFAPETAAHARALLVAAQKAEQEQDATGRDQAMREAVEALTNARRTARGFRKKYAATLKLEQAASEAAGSMLDSGLTTAESTMNGLIHAFEHGQFNDSAPLAESAYTQLLTVLRRTLPAILQKTDEILLQAKRSGAKRYAPVTYNLAKQWLADALAYTDGLSHTWPARPRLGMRLAARADEIARQVRQWRKKPGSYEELVLKARDERLDMGRALALPLDKDDPSFDVAADRIIKGIQQQRLALAAQQQRHEQQLAALEKQYAHQIREKNAALRDELTQAQGKQMGELKEAFRAKLERETFESRRQKKLGTLFKKDEVEILANVDGSMLLRLTALQFASGRTSIDKKYFDLLSRVRSGLALYPERKIVIEGHTDNRGEPDINQRVSLRRAETVRDFLRAAGMDGSRLKALGYGEVHPVASNDYERGRAMNRRIDIIIQAAK